MSGHKRGFCFIFGILLIRVAGAFVCCEFDFTCKNIESGEKCENFDKTKGDKLRNSVCLFVAECTTFEEGDELTKKIVSYANQKRFDAVTDSLEMTVFINFLDSLNLSEMEGYERPLRWKNEIFEAFQNNNSVLI